MRPKQRAAQAMAAAVRRGTETAETVQHVLRSLELDGCITARRVLDEARSPSSPLHRFFEWDDHKAGEAYRLEQAQRLIVRFKLEVTTTTGRVQVAGYVRDPRVAPDTAGMVSMQRLMSDSDLAREAVVGEVSRVLDMLRRAHHQAAALGLGDEVQGLIAEAEALRNRIAATAVA